VTQPPRILKIIILTTGAERGSAMNRAAMFGRPRASDPNGIGSQVTHKQWASRSLNDRRRQHDA